MAQVLAPLPPSNEFALPSSQWALMTSSDKSDDWFELSRAANIPTLEEDQVLVRTSHVALNAYDWASSGHANHVIGRDGVGSVIAIGKAVRRLQVGQRIWFCSNSAIHGSGAFQDYSVHSSSEVGIVPSHLSDTEAAALGSGLLTAAVALFGTLGFPLVRVTDSDDSENKHPWILIWGGAGITGVYLIQLARLLGFRVICAASPINHAYVRSLGAEVVLDRWADEESLVAAIRTATHSNVEYAVDNVGPVTAAICHRVLQGLHSLSIDQSRVGKLVPIAGKPAASPINATHGPHRVDILRISFSTVFFDHPDFSNRLMDMLDELLESKRLVAARVKEISGGYEGILSGLQALKGGLLTGGYKLVARIERSGI